MKQLIRVKHFGGGLKQYAGIIVNKLDISCCKIFPVAIPLLLQICELIPTVESCLIIYWVLSLLCFYGLLITFS